MHQQICFDSAQMAGRIIPVEGQRCFFSKHHHLGAHLLQLEFGRWSSTSHTQFFDRPWPTQKLYGTPTALLMMGQQKSSWHFELDGQHIPTKLIFYISHWDIFHHKHFAHEFGYKKSRAPENWHGTQQLVLCKLCSFSKKPIQFLYWFSGVCIPINRLV